MRRFSGVMCGILLAGAVLAPAALAQPTFVRVVFDQSFIQGEGWGDTKEVKATLRDGTGRVKAACWVRTDTTGAFSCQWSLGIVAPGATVPPAVNEPGDTLTLEHEGSAYASGVLAGVHFTAFSPATDRVAGRISPRRANVRVRVYPAPVVTPTGWGIAPPYFKDGTPARDGTFSVDLTSAGNLARRDQVFAGYRRGRFEIGALAFVPGLRIQKDDNRADLVGIPGATYRVGLYSARGLLKAETTVKLEDFGILNGFSAPNGLPPLIGRGGRLVFRDAAGGAVPIRAGDQLRVIGPAGFRFRVPRLSLQMGSARIASRYSPSRPIGISACLYRGPGTGYACYQQFGKTDATGLFTFTPPEPVAFYSFATATITAGGNEVSTARSRLP